MVGRAFQPLLTSPCRPRPHPRFSQQEREPTVMSQMIGSHMCDDQQPMEKIDALGTFLRRGAVGRHVQARRASQSRLAKAGSALCSSPSKRRRLPAKWR